MLFNLKKPDYIGIYFAPETKWIQFGGSMTSLSGGSGSILINKKWSLGVSGYYSFDRNYSPASIKPLYLRGGLASGRIEYTPYPNSALHVSFPFAVGMGFASADSTSERFRGVFDVNNRRDGFRNRANEYVVIQPAIHLEANVIRYAKVFIGAGYNIGIRAGTSSTRPVPSNAFTGVNLNLGVKFGYFDYYLHKKSE